MNINPMELFKNFQNIQSKLAEMQDKLKDVKVTGSSGGGMAQVEMDGKLSVTKVIISPDIVNPQDVEMLQDLVLAAFTDALAKIKDKMKEEASSVTGGIDLPPGFLGL